MAKRDSFTHTLTVAGILCLVCSVIVSFAAVQLRSLQQKNARQDQQKNILIATGLYQENISIAQQFEKIKPVVVDLQTGEETQKDPQAYDQEKASKSSKQSVSIPSELDKADIKRRARWAKIYKVQNESGQVDQYVFPVKGKGLWGTMYGYIALAKDTSTVKGFAFYQHKETPGLGAEVDNPKWKAQWPGKKIYSVDFQKVMIELLKGAGNAQGPYQADGLSGATITTRAVNNILKYWFGDHGYGQYLARVRQGSAQ